MNKRLENKKAIVTGGSRGIGEGIVKRLYDEGCHIIIADIRKELAENLIESVSPRPPVASIITHDGKIVNDLVKDRM